MHTEDLGVLEKENNMKKDLKNMNLIVNTIVDKDKEAEKKKRKKID